MTVSLTVTNKASVATNDYFITRRNTNLVIAAADVTDNDSDSDADTITRSSPFSIGVSENG